MALQRLFSPLALIVALGCAGPVFAQDLPTQVPAGTKLIAADQNEKLQTLLKASGEEEKIAAEVTYANFIGGPAILEAFRAGALDIATVGNAPPIQAHAAGEEIPIVATRATSEPDYHFAVRPGLKVGKLEEFRGKRIAYAEGTGRQPFVLTALKLAGLTTKDVTLVPLRASDFPDAIRTGQVDIAALNDPHLSRYIADFTSEGGSALPDAEHDRLPRNLTYLYASAAALKDPAKSAAIRDFVQRWIAANRWASANAEQWVDAYYVKVQQLKPEDGHAVVESEGEISFPLLKDLIAQQQATIDLIFEAGDIPERLDAREEFDLRFDEAIAAANS